MSRCAMCKSWDGVKEKVRTFDKDPLHRYLCRKIRESDKRYTSGVYTVCLGCLTKGEEHVKMKRLLR